MPIEAHRIGLWVFCAALWFRYASTNCIAKLCWSVRSPTNDILAFFRGIAVICASISSPLLSLSFPPSHMLYASISPYPEDQCCLQRSIDIPSIKKHTWCSNMECANVDSMRTQKLQILYTSLHGTAPLCIEYARSNNCLMLCRNDWEILCS